MAENPTLLTLTSLANATTAITQLNTNFSNIATAFTDVVSRSAVSPNTMLATQDMNSNRLINLPSPISTTEPVTLGYFNSVLAGGNQSSGLVTGIPVSAAMQPVVNASTLVSALSLLGAASSSAVVSSFNGNVGAITATVNVKTFSTVGTSTYTPTSGMTHCMVECVGGGGGGGGVVGNSTFTLQGGGGASGQYSRKLCTAAQIGPFQTVTIGAGGAGGVAGAHSGAAGGATSVGTLCVANGGGGGGFTQIGVQLGNGGIPSNVAGTGDIATDGNYGGSGCLCQQSGGTIYTPTGTGAASALGGGAVENSLSTGTNGGKYGAGGAGAFGNLTSSSFAGGNGSNGFVIITEYINI